MKSQYHIELLKTVWRIGGVRELYAVDNDVVEVRRAGEYNEQSGRFTGAEIVASGVVYCGDVMMWAGDDPPAENYESCVLQVVPFAGAHIFKQDGSPLIQGILKAGAVCELAYETLKDGATEYGCAKYIAAMESHQRIAMFTRLLTDRLHRKCNDLRGIYDECEKNWNETMYVMLLRTMGDSRNKEAFTELARRVRYSMISRERDTILYVEALLIGTSGLLEIYGNDSYIRDLKNSFAYLRNKYSITPMTAGQWNSYGNNPHNHPILRMAQLAAFLATREFLFDNLIKCRSTEDVHVFFRAEASQYWSTHYIPSVRSGEYPKRVGYFKANLLGINLAVPMMFAYGDYTGDEELKERSLDLLEKINCEDNRYINAWRSGGVQMESAFDSQAMLQLNNEFCLKGLCWQCLVGRRVIGKLLKDANS